MFEGGQPGGFAIGHFLLLPIELGQLLFRGLAGGIGFRLGFLALGGEFGRLFIRRSLGFLQAVLFLGGFARCLIGLLLLGLQSNT